MSYRDGSKFVGNGNWSASSKSQSRDPKKRYNYYVNAMQKIRVPCEAVEGAMVRVLKDIADKSPRLQKALSKLDADKEKGLKILTEQLAQLEQDCGKVDEDQRKLDTRLDFLLETKDQNEARKFREEYVAKTEELSDQRKSFRAQIIDLQNQRKKLAERQLDLNHLKTLAHEGIELAHANSGFANFCRRCSKKWLWVNPTAWGVEIWSSC